ncbi:MAG: hypothetical protein ACI9BD_001162 [Candidatus Marinamargulisbacteria bacterium]|jgi:hypothetical protein
MTCLNGHYFRAKKKGLFILFLLFPIVVFAHSAKTNADGCHMDYSIRDYHCHDQEDAFSTDNNGGQEIAQARTNYCLVVKDRRYCGYAKNKCTALMRKYGGYCDRSF